MSINEITCPTCGDGLVTTVGINGLITVHQSNGLVACPQPAKSVGDVVTGNRRTLAARKDRLDEFINAPRDTTFTGTLYEVNAGARIGYVREITPEPGRLLVVWLADVTVV
jgi:hypothetical protein